MLARDFEAEADELRAALNVQRAAAAKGLLDCIKIGVIAPKVSPSPPASAVPYRLDFAGESGLRGSAADPHGLLLLILAWLTFSC